MTREQWIALWDAAEGAKANAGDQPAVNQIKGRWITVLVHELVVFWGKHKSALLRYLSVAAIAALEAIVSAEPQIAVINPPGPE